MMLRSRASDTPSPFVPMMLPDAPPLMTTPLTLGTGRVPARSVPMRFPATRLPVVPAPVISTPLSLVFPEMRLPSAASLTAVPVGADDVAGAPALDEHAVAVPQGHGAAGVDADEVALDAVVRPADDLNAGHQWARVEVDDVQPADQAAADAGEGQAGRAELVASPSNWISGAPKPEPG